MRYGKCKTGPLHTQQPRSFIFIRLRPVHPAVAGGQLADLLLELFGQLGLFQELSSPSQSCMGMMQVAAALRKISAIMLL